MVFATLVAPAVSEYGPEGLGAPKGGPHDRVSPAPGPPKLLDPSDIP